MGNHLRARAIICPNPKCHRKVEEPILLNNFSTAPAEQYPACPNCFSRLRAYTTRVNLAGLFLTAFGSAILAWVGWLIWHDVTVWGKDITLIFFGSRTGEPICLGIGMKVIYYFLISLTLLFSGLFTSLRRRSQTIESHLSVTAREKQDAGTVEVTFKLPRKLVNFLKNLEECRGTTVEEYLQDSVFGRVAADLGALDERVLAPNAYAQLVEDYGLKGIMKDRSMQPCG